MNKMNITPEQLQEWVSLFWQIGWRGLLVFSVLYYRELLIYAGKGFIDVVVSWFKKK